MAMTFRDVKGSILSNAEADANFRTLVDATTKAAILDLFGWDDVVTTAVDITITVGGKEFRMPLETP